MKDDVAEERFSRIARRVPQRRKGAPTLMLALAAIMGIIAVADTSWSLMSGEQISRAVALFALALIFWLVRWNMIIVRGATSILAKQGWKPPP